MTESGPPAEALSTQGLRLQTLAELTYECWNGGGLPLPDAAGATLLSWQVPADESSVGEFDFCFEGIQALVSNSPSTTL